MAILHQPGIDKKMKRVSRLVVLPDYQGIGIGHKFLNEVAKLYSGLGWNFSIITSARNLIYALRKDKKWILYRCSNLKGAVQSGFKSKCRDVTTCSFMYKGEKV